MKTPVLDRSSHRRCSIKKGVLRNFAKFTFEGLRNSCDFAKFLRKPYFQSISSGYFWLEYLLLKLQAFRTRIKNIIYHLIYLRIHLYVKGYNQTL